MAARGGNAHKKQRFARNDGAYREQNSRRNQRHQPVRKKSRVVNDPSATFLAALEAQRENERRRQEEQQQKEQQQKEAQDDTVAKEDKLSGGQAQVPGFYYDEAKNRYFPITKSHMTRVETKRTESVQSSPLTSHCMAHTTTTTSNWVHYLCARESRYAWSAAQRDRRELLPQLFRSEMVRDVAGLVTNHARRIIIAFLLRHIKNFDLYTLVKAINISGRWIFTDQEIVELWLSDGRLQVFTVEHQIEKRGSKGCITRKRLLDLHTANVAAPSFTVSCARWHPTAHALLYGCIGMDTSMEHEHTHRRSGYVKLFDSDQHYDNVQAWTLKDPASIQWNLRDPSLFAVGTGGPACAAYINAEISGNGSITWAPVGKIRSDVLAQSFLIDGNTILNGARNGGIWLWDLRAGRRAYESKKRVAGSAVVDVHALSDGFRVLLQKSDGELTLIDLRKYRQVVEYVAGQRNKYRPLLKCAVDETESVLFAAEGGKGNAVCSYHMHSAKPLFRMDVDVSEIEKPFTPVEQVYMQTSTTVRNTEDPEVWAMSKSELFVSGRVLDSQN